jgi:iron complex outermembrane receptor protein
VRTTLVLASALAGAVSLIVPAAAATAAPLEAQDKQDKPVSPDPASPDEADIIVTAQRVSQRLIDVPIAVTAISGDTLAARGFNDPSQIQYLSPSLITNGTGATTGLNNYTIRGVGTSSNSNAIQYSVSTVIDNVSLGLPEMASGQFSDVERVEVLRGPQGTLFGRNASAGVVQIITKKPVIGKTNGSIHVDAAYADTPGARFFGKAEGILNVAVSSNSALRINGFGTYQPPLVKDLNPNPASDYSMHEWGLRAKYLWQPTPDLDVYLLGDQTWEKGLGAGGFAFYVLPSAGNPLFASNQAAGIVAGPDNLMNSAGAPANGYFRSGGVQLSTEYRFGDGWGLTNILAYRSFVQNVYTDSDQSAINYSDLVGVYLNNKQYTEELRIASPTASPLQIQAGIYLFRAKYQRITSAGATLGRTDLPPGVGALGGTVTSDANNDSAAVFGQVTYHVTDKLRVTAGGRETYDKIELNTVAANTSNLVAQFGVGSLDQRRSIYALSYKFDVDYNFTPNLMGYVSYARGYKGPAFNATIVPASAIAVNPEIPLAWEAGLKADTFDRRLQVNIAAYSTKFKGYQSQILLPGQVSSVLQNAGALRTRGVEVEFSAKPTKSLSVTGGFSFTDARFLSFLGVPCYTGQTSPASCLTLRTMDASGVRLAIPKFVENVTVRYDHEIGGGLRGFVSGSAYARSKQYPQPNGDPNTVIPAYQVFDASIGMSAPDQGWKLSLYGRNLGDKRVRNAFQANPSARTSYQQSFNLNSFRTIGVTFDLNF